MVARAPIEHFHMNVAAHTLGTSLEEVMNQFAPEMADAWPREGQVDDRMWAAAEIHGCDAQRLIHRHDEVPGAIDASPGTQRLRYRFSECDAEIFDGMVLV